MSYDQWKDIYGNAQPSSTLKAAGVVDYATSLRSPYQIIRDALGRAEAANDYIAMADLATKLYSLGR